MMEFRELNAAVLEALSCTHYTPGHPDFEAVAAQCKDITLIHKGTRSHSTYINQEIDRRATKRRNESVHEARG